MTLDLSNPSGFSKFWNDVVTAFREVAVDNATNSGGNLHDGSDPVINDHIKGPVDGQTLASQYAYPVIWTVPQQWVPAYQTNASDQGEMQIQVVAFTMDQDAETGFQKARELLGRIVNNIEDDRSLSGGSTDAAGSIGRTELTNFQMDFVLSTEGGQRAQLTWGQALFDLHAKRLL